MERGRLTRSETDKMVAGVCGGLGEFFTVDPTIVRVVFVIASFFGGGGVLLYIAMWIIVPRASRVDVPSRDVVRENVDEGRKFAEDAARSARERFDRLRGGPSDASGQRSEATGTAGPAWEGGGVEPEKPEDTPPRDTDPPLP